MNLWTLEYVLEVAKAGSISRAAQNLLLSQPHLSNTIKGLENELGIALFHRSAKGVALTEEGRHFVQEAEQILQQVDRLGTSFHVRPSDSIRINVSVTRSYQINRCITNFINENAKKPHMLLHIKETNPFQVLKDVRTHESELGILHFFETQREYFLNCFKTYSLRFEKHYERDFLVLMSARNRLVGVPTLTRSMLADQIVVVYGDYEIRAASYQTVAETSDIIFSSKRVYVYDRATAMETVSQCPDSYMWITGLHPDTLRERHLVLRRCEGVQVHNLGYSISSADAPLSKTASELLTRMKRIDWTEDVAEDSD